MLSGQNRLKKEKDFYRVFKEGKISRGHFLQLKAAKNDYPYSRFGFSVSLRVSKKATLRNRLKRILSEAIRKSLKEIKGGYDIVVLVQKDAVLRQPDELNREIKNIIKKASLDV